MCPYCLLLCFLLIKIQDFSLLRFTPFFSDKLLPWPYVEEVIRVQSGTGRTVLSKLFEKSGPAGHVAHLKYHPIEYKESVKKLLDAT